MPRRTISPHLWTGALCQLILVASLASAASPCGGYRDGLTAGQSFWLTSPNYPSLYPRNQRCIWLFVATSGTGFAVNVTSVNLEGSGNDSSGCKDYLQITDGSSRANQLAYLCQVSSPVQILGSGLYLWIKFQSDHQVQRSGFELTVRTVQSSNASTNGTPIISCNITRYTCPNKECIYTGSLCDSVNDCGCDDYGCDETKCWKFSVLNNLSVVWGIGTGVGLAVSITTFLACGFLEMPASHRPECMRRRPDGGDCFAKCRRNRIQHQQTPEDAFMAMMKRMTGDNTLRWDAAESETESGAATSRGATPRSSISGPAGGSSPSASRRSSIYAGPLYGNTLSPKDSLKVASVSAKAQPPGPRTLAVPTTGASIA